MITNSQDTEVNTSINWIEVARIRVLIRSPTAVPSPDDRLSNCLRWKLAAAQQQMQLPEQQQQRQQQQQQQKRDHITHQQQPARLFSHRVPARV